MFARLFNANINSNNYNGDDERVIDYLKDNPGQEICFVARKTYFVMGYKSGWEWAHKHENEFFKNIRLDKDLAKASKENVKDPNNTWIVGFCAGAMNYIYKYLEENEKI